MLEFDKEFFERPVKEQLEYLHKLCASQNDALDTMQKERNEWRDKAKQLEKAVENAEAAFYIQKDIVQNLLTKTNDDDRQTHDRIHDLEKRVEALGGDIN